VSKQASSERIALIGNPNTGKTTLFNALTGSRARVGNYPGVTVERRTGKVRLASHEAELLDLPGTYSLTARSPEEQIAIQEVLGDGSDAPGLVLVVVDAGQLVRNGYLVLQLAELEVPLVVALNMIDEVDSPPDPKALEGVFGAPVVPLAAKSGRGLDDLRRVLGEQLSLKPSARAPRVRPAIAYPEPLLADAAAIVGELPARWRGVSPGRDEALALWALGSVDEHDELRGLEPGLRQACLARLTSPGRDHDAEIIMSRYRFLDERVAPLVTRGVDTKVRRASERIDRVLLHPVWGFAVFVALMLTVFQSLFSWSDPAIETIEAAVAWLGGALSARLPAGVLTDLLVEGVLGGVGNVIVFLPQILLLFLFLGLLEDSGYMARAAYLMDRVMKALGLHGRAFVPMLSGCACAIPAIMATRTMERERDRLLTMLVIPLMTCSARLPVYTLIIGALFPPTKVFGFLPVQALLMVAMYLFSTLMALVAAGVLGRTVVKGRRVPLLIELPPYRMPAWRNVLRQMVERAASFFKEAGTMILACTVVLWALLSFPRTEPLVPPPASPQVDATSATAPKEAATEAEPRAQRLQQSYGARLGKAIEPAIAPLGFDWKIGVGLIGAFAAREVFVSTMGLVHGIGDANEGSEPLRAKMRAESRGGEPAYSPLVGLSLMVFFALACQCMSTLAVVRRETRSWRWPAFLLGYMTTLAWLSSFLVFQLGTRLGF